MLYTVHYTIHYALQTAHFATHTKHYTLYTTRYKLLISLYKILLHCTLHSTLLLLSNDALSMLLKTLCFCSEVENLTRVSCNSYPRHPITQRQNKTKQNKTNQNKHSICPSLLNCVFNVVHG
jgi:hypothetical protein